MTGIGTDSLTSSNVKVDLRHGFPQTPYAMHTLLTEICEIR